MINKPLVLDRNKPHVRIHSELNKEITSEAQKKGVGKTKMLEYLATLGLLNLKLLKKRHVSTLNLPFVHVLDRKKPQVRMCGVLYQQICTEAEERGIGKTRLLEILIMIGLASSRGAEVFLNSVLSSAPNVSLLQCRRQNAA